MATRVTNTPSDTTRTGGLPRLVPVRHRRSGAVWGALLIVYVVWGSTYLAIRIGVATMPPFLFAGTRFVVAGVLLAALVAWRQGTAALRVTRRQFASAATVGLLLLFGGNALVVLAETSLPSGPAALLTALIPVWLVLLRRADGDRPRAATVLGVLLGLAGLIVLTIPGSGGGVRLGGVLTVVTGTLMWSGGSFAASKLPLPANSFSASAYEMIAGGLGCLALGVVRGEQDGLDLGAVSTRSWLALVYLIVFGSLVAFTAYVWLLHSAPLSLVATYAYVNPVVAVVLGWVVLGEPLTWPVLSGGAIVVAGVCVVVSTERRGLKKAV
ncbi:EamA family transporter [Kitasatospora sp. NPDC001660]